MSEIEKEPVADGSLMAQLRQKHQALHEARTIEIPLPGYDELLIARYRVLDVQKEISKIGRKVSVEFKDPLEQGVFGAIDTMVTACVELLTTKDDKRVPLSGAFGPDTPPVRFDKRLAEFMGWGDEVETAREVVLRLFDDIEPMIVEHAQMLSRWMGNVTRQVNDSFAGNL